MGFIAILSLLAIGAALFTSTFVRFAIYECKNYKIGSHNDKTILITGANSGLGYHTSLALAKAGASVVMACRSKSKCEEAKQNILDVVPNGKIDTAVLDLSSFQSIRDFASQFISTYEHLDVLVNNAGIMAIPTRELTSDGLELQIGTNHFGHFLLTSLLFPIISKNGRIVNHSSGAHHMTSSGFYSLSDLQSETTYDPWTAYGNSKAANLLFTYELNNRLIKSNDDRHIISVAVHPGYTNTNLQTDRFPLHEYVNNFFAMSGEDGALSQIEAAVDPNVKASHNDFIGPKYLMFGAPAVQATSSKTWNEVAQQRLWEESVRLTGADFGGL